jgi:hypothetical protein
MDLRDAALKLYGPGLSDNQYIRRLAVDLRMSEHGVRKNWYQVRRLSGPAEALLERLVAETDK